MVLTSAEREVIRRDTDERIRLALQGLEFAPPVSGDGSNTKIKQVSDMAFMETAVYDPGGLIEQLVGVSAAQALSNKTLLSPVVESFELANHSHVDAQGAGQLTSSAIPTAFTVDRISEIVGLTAKASPAVKDLVVIESQVDGFAKRKVELGDLPSAGGGDSLPVVDTKSIVEDPGDPTREMRIDVGAVTTGTVRVLFMPDEDIDLTPGATGTYPARVHDHETAGEGGLLGSLAIPSAFTNDVTGQIAALTQKVTPLGADHVLIESAADGNAKRRVLISDFPAGSEANDLETDGTAGIAPDELPMGTGANVVTYTKISVLAEEATPASGDWVLGENLAGNLVKMDPDNIGGGSGPEVNDLVTDGTAGIALDQVPLGTGAGTVAYTSRSGIDDTAIHDNVGGEINALAAVVPLATDVLLIEDQSDTFNKKAITAGAFLNPKSDAQNLLFDAGDVTAQMRIDIGLVASVTTRVLTYPDQNIDLTPGTGSFATEAEGNLAATAVQDGGDLSAGTVAHTALANFAPESILLREAGAGAPSDSIFTDIATSSPVGADFILGWLSTGEIRKYTITSLPAGGEVNALEADGASGIAIGEVVVGTGAGTAVYSKISALVEETTPAAGDFLLGEESGGLVRKFDIGDLPSGTPAADSITNVELANMLADTIKGRATGGGTGDPQDLTATQVRTILGIEAGSTADQTDAEIKTAYENNANTNEFDDAEQTKLGTVATNADVTDEASVTAALPVIDSTTLVKGSVTATKLMRIEVDGFAGAVTRVLTMADSDIDLTPGTGSFATEAEGNLAATALQVEVNDLVADGAAGIEIDEVFVGSGTDTGVYVATIGSGTVVRSQSPTLATPTLTIPVIAAAGWASANHTHVGGTTGGQVAIASTTGTLTETRGGTDQTTYAQGDLLHSTSANQLGKLAVGTTGQELRVNAAGTLPEWHTKEPSKSFTLPLPVIGDIFGVWITNKAITITEIQAICHNGTSVIVNVRNHTVIAAAGGTLIDQITPTTAITSETTITSASVAADRCIFFELGTVTGSVDSVMVTINYTIDA